MIKSLAIFIVTVLLFWLIGLISFTEYVSHLKIGQQQDAVQTDSIIVLTGGPERINTALDMLQDGMAEELLVSGVDHRVSIADLLTFWKQERSLTDEAPIPCCVTLDASPANTRENALSSAEWVAENNISTIRLITGHTHMPRALLEFRHAMPDAKIYVTAVKPAPHIEPIQKTLLYIFAEYHKFMAVAFRTYILEFWIPKERT